MFSLPRHLMDILIHYNDKLVVTISILSLVSLLSVVSLLSQNVTTVTYVTYVTAVNHATMSLMSQMFLISIMSLLSILSQLSLILLLIWVYCGWSVRLVIFGRSIYRVSRTHLGTQSYHPTKYKKLKWKNMTMDIESF